jgi:hypothetical protein
MTPNAFDKYERLESSRLKPSGNFHNQRALLHSGAEVRELDVRLKTKNSRHLEWLQIGIASANMCKLRIKVIQSRIHTYGGQMLVKYNTLKARSQYDMLLHEISTLVGSSCLRVIHHENSGGKR